MPAAPERERERERERGQLYKVFIGADKDSGVNYLFTDLMDINLHLNPELFYR